MEYERGDRGNNMRRGRGKSGFAWGNWDGGKVKMEEDGVVWVGSSSGGNVLAKK
jgi:hypothetical protein